MKRLCLSAVLFLTCVPLHAADGGVAKLHAFLQDVKTLKAGFTQQVFDANGKQVKQSTGRLSLKRPDRFRWDYAKPDEETIVADGKKLWIYDAQLQQVTVKTMSSNLATSPAVLLAGSNDVEKNFTVVDLGEKDSLVWVQLIPKVKDSDFESVKLAFKGGDVSVMELRDNLGGLTRIELDHLQRNPAVSDDDFRFTPPPGADVIGDTADGTKHD